MLKTILTRKFVLLITLTLAVSMVLFLLSFRTQKSDTQNGKIRIVTSFYPLSHIASIVGGEMVTVRNLVPAGVEPHDFEPSPRDLIEIGNADILIYNGSGLEPWVKKWEQSVFPRPIRIVNMASALRGQGVNLIENGGATDPHFWLDPTIMKSEVIVVRDVLIQTDPLFKDFFSDNSIRYSNELDSLDRHFRADLASCSLRDIVVLHEAFSYLARQYRFTATAIEGISPEEEPSPRELARIVSLVRAKGVKYIFSETIASPKFSELIAREIGGTTLVLNPIESLTPNEVQLGEDYVSVMEMNLGNLQKAMSCP